MGEERNEKSWKRQNVKKLRGKWVDDEVGMKIED